MVVNLLAVVLILFDAPQSPREIMARAVEDFRAGRIEQAVAGFDQLAKLIPGQAPELWQRGIAQYYAGRFRECRDMFVSHRTVNPADVENAAWHFLCVARAESPEAARKQILPVGPDARVPMREVYQLFQGRATVAQVLAAAGDRVKGREQIAIAAQDRYAGVGGYMHDVARVHMKHD